MQLKKLLKAGCKYLRSADYRFLINAGFGLYNHMPDEEYLKRKFKACMGKELNLENPQTFNEKLQWLKLYDRKPEYTMMVDKVKVRGYIAETIGEEYLIPLLGVWEDPEDIDFDALPNQFVLKPNHASGNVLICRSKNMMNRKKAYRTMKAWLRREYYWGGREWPYKDIKPCILAEKMIEDQIIDYKFYCFGGEPKCLYLSKGLENHTTAQISFFDLDLNKMPFSRSDFAPFQEAIQKPDNFAQMVKIVEKLAKDFPFIRVDLYSVSGKIYFSELTFFPCSGYMPFAPESWDQTLGNWIKL